MDNQNQILLDQLLALLRAGCEVRLTPRRTPMGFIDARVRVIPPPSDNPTTPLEEFRKIKTGAAVALPLQSGISLYYRPEQLQGALKSAALLYVRRPPTSAKS